MTNGTMDECHNHALREVARSGGDLTSKGQLFSLMLSARDAPLWVRGKSALDQEMVEKIDERSMISSGGTKRGKH